MANKNGADLGKLLAKLTDRMKKDKRFELCVYGVLVLAGILIYAATTVPKSNADLMNETLHIIEKGEENEY